MLRCIGKLTHWQFSETGFPRKWEPLERHSKMDRLSNKSMLNIKAHIKNCNRCLLCCILVRLPDRGGQPYACHLALKMNEINMEFWHSTTEETGSPCLRKLLILLLHFMYDNTSSSLSSLKRSEKIYCTNGNTGGFLKVLHTGLSASRCVVLLDTYLCWE